MPTWKNIDPEELKRLEAMCSDPRFPHMEDLEKHYTSGEFHKEMKANKYHNQKTRGFHSKKEADRYDELVMMQKAGLIRNLRCQVPYILLKPFRDKKRKWYSGIKYFADFVYEQKDDSLVFTINGCKFGHTQWPEIVEDCKSAITSKDKTYRLKLQLLLAQNPDINFIET